MERYIKSNEIILLFDKFTLESRWLYESVKKSGFENVPIVLEENDFLPEGILSVYDLFLDNDWEEKKNYVRPKYYNEIVIPDNWSINAGVNEEWGQIIYQHEERGRIYYVKEKKYFVRAVEWYDRKGTIRFCDHYNRFGDICGRTVYNSEGQPMSKTWFSPQGKEVIVENFVTSDIILNDGIIEKIFRSKLDLFIYYFEKLGFAKQRIFFNSLSTPFFISNGLESLRRQDILFWQEPIGNDIPWNMQMILDGRSIRIDKVIVQKENSYNRLLELRVPKEKIFKLGFIYSFEKENQYRPEALICTNSDEIEHCRELIENFPQMHFHIAALTTMSSRLLDLEHYKNVSLYPGALPQVLDGLFQKCDYYFDINHYAEIVSAVQRAFLHNHLIFAFEETAHDREYVANEHIYPITEFVKMVSHVREIMEDRAIMEQHLEKQHGHALLEDKEAYKKIINMREERNGLQF